MEKIDIINVTDEQYYILKMLDNEENINGEEK